MKVIVIGFCLLFSLLAKSQTEQVVVYRNAVEGYSFQYPEQWDSTSFSKIKEKFKANFGVIIKPTFNNNKTGGFFTLREYDSFSSDLNVIAKETETSLKKIYPDATIIHSNQTISKNKVPYYFLITQIEQFGSTRITNKIQILKGIRVYEFSFTCPKDGYERLKTYFENLVDSFKFETK